MTDKTVKEDKQVLEFRNVVFDFDNAPASVLEGVKDMADPTKNMALSPREFGAMIGPMIVSWSFEGFDPHNPEDYLKLKLKDYRWLLRQFTDKFSAFFAEN